MTRAAQFQPKMPPVHPGEVLLADFLEPLGLSQYRLARVPLCSRIGRY